MGLGQIARREEVVAAMRPVLTRFLARAVGPEHDWVVEKTPSQVEQPRRDRRRLPRGPHRPRRARRARRDRLAPRRGAGGLAPAPARTARVHAPHAVLDAREWVFALCDVDAVRDRLPVLDVAYEELHADSDATLAAHVRVLRHPRRRRARPRDRRGQRLQPPAPDRGEPVPSRRPRRRLAHGAAPARAPARGGRRRSQAGRARLQPPGRGPPTVRRGSSSASDRGAAADGRCFRDGGGRAGAAARRRPRRPRTGCERWPRGRRTGTASPRARSSTASGRSSPARCAARASSPTHPAARAARERRARRGALGPRPGGRDRERPARARRRRRRGAAAEGRGARRHGLRRPVGAPQRRRRRPRPPRRRRARRAARWPARGYADLMPPRRLRAALVRPLGPPAPAGRPPGRPEGRGPHRRPPAAARARPRRRRAVRPRPRHRRCPRARSPR